MSALDSREKQAKAAMWLLLVPQLLLLLFISGLMPWQLSGGWLFALWFATSIVAAVTAVTIAERYKSQYKKEVVTPLIEQVDPSAVYEPNGRLDPSVLDATGLFPRAPEAYGDDRIRGNLNGVPFQFSNVHLWREVRRHDHDVRETLFRGLFLQIALPYTVNGLTCLIDDDAEPAPPRALKGSFEKVDLGLGERFDAQYDVWTSSPTDAKALLTPELAQRLAEHGEDSDYPPRLAFHDGFVSLAVDCGDVLEPSFDSRESAQNTAFEVEGVFGLARAVIDILKVQAPRFAATAAVSAAATPWDQHGRAKPTNDLRQIAEKVRGTGVGVALEGTSTMTLQYGLRPGLFYALVIGLLWMAIASTIAGIATGTPGEGSPLRLTTLLPMLTGAFTWLAQYHPAATAVALIAGLISLSSTLQHVRRATLTKNGVTIVRVLWPLPQRKTVEESPSVTMVQRNGVFVGSTRVSPPLPFETGAVVAHSVASFYGVEASVPIKESAVKFNSNLRVGGKNYSSSNR